MKRNSAMKNRFSRTDAAAAVTFVFLAFFLLSAAFYNDAAIADEANYLTLGLRLTNGDGPLVQEWHLAQLPAIFYYCIYSPFVRLTGGTEGIILYSRLAFVVVDLAAFCWFYRKLRDLGAAAVIAPALLCADQFFGFTALNYYNVAQLGVAALVILFFFEKKELSRLRLVLIGVLISFLVIYEISLAALYPVFCALVLIREIGKKKNKNRFGPYARLIDGRVWLWTAVGITVSAALFALYLQCTSGIANIIRTVPELFTDSEYEMTAIGNGAWAAKFADCAAVLGIPLMTALPLFAILCAVLKKKKNTPAVKTALTFCAFALMLVCYAVIFARLASHFKNDAMPFEFTIKQYAGNAIPVYVFGLVFYILSDKKQPGIFAFWIAAAALSFCMDYVSDVTLGFGGRLAYFPAVCYALSLLRELREERVQTAGAAVSPAILKIVAGLAVLLLACQAGNLFFSRNYCFINARNLTDASVVTVEKGPYRGVRTTADLARWYDAILADLDDYKAVDGGVAYVAAHIPFTYLYLEQQIGTYSTNFVDTDIPERISRYWELNPEKRPTHIYVPYYALFSEYDETMASVEKLGRCSLTEGNGGTIVKIEEWY